MSKAKFPCPHCGAAKLTLNGLCLKCSRFSNFQADEPSEVIVRKMRDEWPDRQSE